MPYYLFRLDDITPTMNTINFYRCLDIFNKYSISPIIGIVPENKDPGLDICIANSNFLKEIKSLWHQRKIIIAQHGYNHVYHRSTAALLYKFGIGSLSEFSGLDYKCQYNKINSGKIILDRTGLQSRLWMAPNHSFDRVTLQVLRDLNFLYITDGIGLFPYRKHGIQFLPVLSGKPRRIPFGMTTICLHTNSMEENDFRRLESFIKNVKCISFKDAIDMPIPIYASLVNLIVRIFFYIIKIFTNFRRSLRSDHN